MIPYRVQAQEQSPTDEFIRQLLQQRINGQKKGVGIVVGWVDANGSRVVGYGNTKLEGGSPVNGKTIFEIGSVSKVFTSLLLAAAVEKGEVKLDDPVSKYLPPGTKVPSRNGRQITLLDLSTHRSGLPRMPDNIHSKDAGDPYADTTPEEMYAFLASYTLPRDIGAEFEYSNFGAALLGQALARRAGESYEHLLTDRVCRPLGMDSTSVTLNADEQARLAAPYHEDLSPATNWNLAAFAGAGGIRSDVEDMLRFVSAEMGLAPSSLSAAMKATQQARNSTGGPKAEIGLGWMIEHPDNTQFVWHNGATGGYHSYVGIDMTRHWGVVVLSNSGNSVDDLGYLLTHPPKKHTAIALKPETVDEYVGRYQIVPTFIINFSREGNRYFFQATNQGKIDASPESTADFFLKGVDAQISFVKDGTGKVASLILHQNGHDQTATRLP